jgi:hypothetical protein
MLPPLGFVPKRPMHPQHPAGSPSIRRHLPSRELLDSHGNILDGGKLIAFGHRPRSMPADAIPCPRLDPSTGCSALPPGVVGLDTRVGEGTAATCLAQAPHPVASFSRAWTGGPRPLLAGGTLRWYHTLGRQANLFRFYRGYLNLRPPLVGRLRLGRAAVADRRATKHQRSSPLRLTEVDAPPRSPDRRAPPTAPKPWLMVCRRCIRRAQSGGLPEPPAGPPQSTLVAGTAASWRARALPQRKTLRIRPSMPGRCRSCCGVEITVDLRCFTKRLSPCRFFAGILLAHLQSRSRWPAFFRRAPAR